MNPKSFAIFLLINCAILFQISETSLDRKTITSPNYPGPYPWTYFKDTAQHYSDSPQNRIRIVFKNVQLHPLDSLTIYDGRNDCSYPLAQFRGERDKKYFPMMIFSITQRICISFNRYHGGYPGYELDIFEFPRCDGDLTDEYGDIVSPNYNYVHYDAKSTCQWRIRAAKGQAVQFTVEEFSVACGAGDEVTIGDEKTSVSLCQRRLSTSTDIISVNNSLALINFKSVSRDKGFWIKYKMVGCPEPVIADQYGSPTNRADYYHYGYTLGYTCPRGFWYSETTRNISVTCLTTGLWRPNHKVISCTPVDCGDPGTPRNALRSIHDNSFHHQSSVYYRCEKNYVLLGSAVRTCQINGEWSGEQPLCQGKPTECSLPPDPVNGDRNNDNTTFGAVVSFACEEGYRLAGNESIVCLEEGEWSDKPPTCNIVECPSPVIPANGSIKTRERSSTIFQYGDYVEFACHSGFRIIVSEGNGIADCLSNGTWDEDSPTCEPIRCSEPTVPMNGLAEWKSTEYASEVTYDCYPGFTLDGAHVSRCGESGWSSSVPMCQPVLCPALSNDTLDNAYVTSVFVSQSGGFYHYGQTVQVYCDEGFSLRLERPLVSADVECNATGQWTNDVTGGCPHDIQCPALTSATLPSTAVILEGNSTDFGSLYEVHCETTGLVTQLECVSTGTWSPPLEELCHISGNDGSAGVNAEAATKRERVLDLWIIVVIVLGSVVIITVIGGFIVLKRKRRRLDQRKLVAQSEQHEYDNPVYGVNTTNDDQIMITQDGTVGFTKKNSDWLKNPTYNNVAETLERPESFFAEEGLYGNVDDYSKRELS